MVLRLLLAALNRARAGWLFGWLLLAGCASSPEGAKPFVPPIYPPPPEEPRFVFEMTLTSSVQVAVDSEKARLRYLLTGEQTHGEALAKPFDVAVCQGRVYVSDTVKRRVLAFDFPGRRYFEIGDSDPGSLHKPLGVATDADCNVYVADGTLQRVLIYDQDGGYRSAVGGPTLFRRISHVAVDADGSRLYAVDTGGVDTEEHRVRVFDVRAGRHLFDFGRRGKDRGELNLPRDLVVAPSGKVYVVDGGNFRVQVFDRDGKPLGGFGEMGSRYGQFSRPKGIAVDRAGNVYVADAAFGNFQIFDPDGKLLLFVGDRSEQPGAGKYMLPAGIDVDEDGRVYFVDQYFQKVDIFRPAALTRDAGFLAARTRPAPAPGASAPSPAAQPR